MTVARGILSEHDPLFVLFLNLGGFHAVPNFLGGVCSRPFSFSILLWVRVVGFLSFLDLGAAVSPFSFIDRHRAPYVRGRAFLWRLPACFFDMALFRSA